MLAGSLCFSDGLSRTSIFQRPLVEGALLSLADAEFRVWRRALFHLGQTKVGARIVRE